MSSSPLSPLLEIQDLDVAAAAARDRCDALPERSMIPEITAGIASTEAMLVAARAERASLEQAEGELGRAVSEVVREIETADLERYSGRHKSRDDAAAHDTEQQTRRDRQATLEEEELGLLESIEKVEQQIGEAESKVEAHRLERTRVEAAISKVEAEVEAELSRLSAARSALEGELPAPVLAAYERVRSGKSGAALAAGRLAGGLCEGCRIKLPRLELRRMLDEPEDALIQCPQCRRVLVREG